MRGWDFCPPEQGLASALSEPWRGGRLSARDASWVTPRQRGRGAASCAPRRRRTRAPPPPEPREGPGRPELPRAPLQTPPPAGRTAPRPSGGTGRPKWCALGGRAGRGDGDSAKSRQLFRRPGGRGGPRGARRGAGGPRGLQGVFCAEARLFRAGAPPRGRGREAGAQRLGGRRDRREARLWAARRGPGRRGARAAAAEGIS